MVHSWGWAPAGSRAGCHLCCLLNALVLFSGWGWKEQGRAWGPTCTEMGAENRALLSAVDGRWVRCSGSVPCTQKLRCGGTEGALQVSVLRVLPSRELRSPRHLLAGSSTWLRRCGENVGWAVGKKGPFVRFGWDVSSLLEFFFFFFFSPFSPPKFHFAKTNSIPCSASVLMVSSSVLVAFSPMGWKPSLPLSQQHPHGLMQLPFPFQSPFHSRATQNPARTWERDAGAHLTPTKEPCCAWGWLLTFTPPGFSLSG